jgi:hypothetical protein
MRPEFDEIISHTRQGSSTARVVVIVGIICVAFLLWIVLNPAIDRASPPAPQTNPITVRSVDTPRPSPRPNARPRATRPAPDTRTSVEIYECTPGGQLVLSDRPCADDARLRKVIVDQPHPDDVARQRQRTQTQQQTGRGDTSEPSTRESYGAARSGESVYVANESACNAVDEAIERLNARMRRGYTSQEGEWLRSQWHALKERRHQLGCRHL